MMMNAYDKIYLEDAMQNLAVMLDYGAMKEGSLPVFFDRFLVSGISEQFGAGNSKYLVGMSGIELAERVFRRTGKESPVMDYSPSGRSAEFWTGWVLAYLQWYTALSFERIAMMGLTPGYIQSLYRTYHEADLSKFLKTALNKIKKYNTEGVAPLKYQRKICKITQQQLSERSGVSLRMIQAYEQDSQDISRAEVRTVIALAKALNCAPGDLVANKYL